MNYYEEWGDGLYYCCDGVADIIPYDYACPEKIDAYLEDEVFEQVCINSFDRLDFENNDDYALLQNRMARVGAWLKSQIMERSKPTVQMAKIRLGKHEVYKYLANHPEWFQNKNADERRYLSCAILQTLINRVLQQETVCDYIVLRGSTLTAMVHDGVLEREFCETLKRYWYRLTLPVDEQYKAT